MTTEICKEFAGTLDIFRERMDVEGIKITSGRAKHDRSEIWHLIESTIGRVGGSYDIFLVLCRFDQEMSDARLKISRASSKLGVDNVVDNGIDFFTRSLEDLKKIFGIFQVTPGTLKEFVSAGNEQDYIILLSANNDKILQLKSRAIALKDIVSFGGRAILTGRYFDDVKISVILV